MQGWGQIHYTDTLYPWDGHAEVQPPEIDWEDAPVFHRWFPAYSTTRKGKWKVLVAISWAVC